MTENPHLILFDVQDKLTLQRLRHEREMARVHAHYQAQLEALQTELAQTRQQMQQQQQGPAEPDPSSTSRTARQRQTRGPEATSAAAFVTGGEGGTSVAFVPPQPPATAEEAAYLKRRLADVQVCILQRRCNFMYTHALFVRTSIHTSTF